MNKQINKSPIVDSFDVHLIIFIEGWKWKERLNREEYKLESLDKEETPKKKKVRT